MTGRPDPGALFGRGVERDHAPPAVRTDPIKHTVLVPPVLDRQIRDYRARAAEQRGWVSVSLQDVAATLLELLTEDQELQARVTARLTGRRRSGGPQ